MGPRSRFWGTTWSAESGAQVDSLRNCKQKLAIERGQGFLDGVSLRRVPEVHDAGHFLGAVATALPLSVHSNGVQTQR